MALGIQKNILWLEVPIDDVLLVQCFNSTDYFGSVQFGPRLVELLFLAKVGEELTTIEEVNEEVQLAVSLESVVQSDDVRVLDLFEDVSLSC